MKIILAIFPVFIFILSGCSSKYPVTFDSKPQGATIVCNGTNWGYSPTTLYYDEKVKEDSSLNLGACSAHWISGETENYGIIDLKQFPNGVITTLSRQNNIDDFIKTYSSIDELCNTVNKLKLLPNYNEANSCKNNIRERLLKANNYQKAYSWGLLDQKTWLLHNGKILEAYQAGLIDKNTADLYLQKQSIDAAQQQVKASQDQADAARRAASAAEDAQFYQQSLLRKYY